MTDRAPTSTKAYLIAGVASVAILIAGFGAWATLSSISGAVIASGRIQSIIDDQTIQHPTGGVVSEILVRDGDVVRAGDILLTLDGTLARAELNSALISEAEMMSRASRIEAERAGAEVVNFPEKLRSSKEPSIQQMLSNQRDIFNARKSSREKEAESLKQRKLQIQSQIEGTLAQLDAAKRQLEIIDGEIVDQTSLLSKGLAQASRVNALRRSEVGLQGQIGQLHSEVARSREKITELQTDYDRNLLGLTEESVTELRSIKTQLLGLVERKITLEDRLRRLDIRAPISGIVHDLKVHALQGVISPADELAQVIPIGRDVIIAARVSPIHIDEVYPGQPASLRFSALNQRVTPTLSGHVVRMSADALVDPSTSATYYQVDIMPDAGELDNLSDRALVPGMPVEAYISTENRSPMSYLLKPFMDYFSRAFRES